MWVLRHAGRMDRELAVKLACVQDEQGLLASHNGAGVGGGNRKATVATRGGP